jgi:transforming growth factor-beta-induced protein
LYDNDQGVISMRRPVLKFAAMAAVAALVSACGGSDDDDPPAPGDIVAVAQATPALSTLVAAVSKAELVNALKAADPKKTVFAPTNAAFDALARAQTPPIADGAALVAALTKEQLTPILTYHVLGSQVRSSAIPFGTPVETLNGATITITAGTAPVIATIADGTSARATITAVDVAASNGVVHLIDKVLIPPAAN